MRRPPPKPIPGPLPAFLEPLAWAGSHVYNAAINRRNQAYDTGAGVEQLPLPVISVGNISTGGTGKTPLVMHIAQLLCRGGHTPIIAMRGYGSKRGGESDEQAQYRQRLANVTVLARPDRYAAVQEFLASGGEAGCVVLDDGFQHRKLRRNLDLVVIDATRPFTQDRLLPLGHLREPAESLGRADGVIVTRAGGLTDGQRADLKRAIEQFHGREPIAWTEHRWVGLDWTQASEDERRCVEELDGLRVLSLCAVGNPAAFNDQLRGTGARIVAQIRLRDHYPYPPRFIGKLLSQAQQAGALAIVTTEKDWMKLRHHTPRSGWPLPMIRPVVEIEFLSGEAALTRLVLDAVERRSSVP